VVSVSPDSATITWATDEECLSTVNYGIDDAYALSQNGSGYAFNHAVTLTGLAQNTTYYFKAQCISGNSTDRERYGSFTTAHSYVAPVQSANDSLNNTVTVNITEVSTVIELKLNNTVENGSLNITYSSSSPVNMTLSVAELGRFVRIEASSDVRESLSSVMLKVYYTDEELEDANLNESSLSMYWYNETTGSWIKLSTDLPWVYGTGVNTEQNYVWANISHFSDYSVGGDNICTLKGDFPECSYVTLQEVINYINKWIAGRAELQDVINLIDGWRTTDI
jgi:hypothetical protein